MQLTFLGKSTQGGGSPILYATDRDTYVVQGWTVPGHEASVEIPMRLLEYLEANTTLAAVLHTTDHGVCRVRGSGERRPGAGADGHSRSRDVHRSRQGSRR